jgi:hypothetical protein
MSSAENYLVITCLLVHYPKKKIKFVTRTRSATNYSPIIYASCSIRFMNTSSSVGAVVLKSFIVTLW